LDEKSTLAAPLRNEVTLILSGRRESGFSGRIQRVNKQPIRPRNLGFEPAILRRNDTIDVYSAADTGDFTEDFTATNVGFRFAADIMKSQMRGTISDLNREPLKTP
jgi:hypothetical protein